MAKLIRQVTALALLALAASCARSKGSDVVPPPTDPVLVKSQFVPAEGMNRREVEIIMGAPKHEGRTKAGEPFAMYEMQPARLRTVVYTTDARVARVIPPQPLQPVQLEYRGD